MDLEQMRDATRNRIGVPAADTFYSDPQLTDLINEALSVISVTYDWPWLQTSEDISTVAGTRLYTPHATWERTKALSIDGFDSLVLISLQESRNWPDDMQDVPVYYTIYEEQIYLSPAPNAVYTLRHDYIRQEPLLILNADRPLLPSQYHYSVVAHAAYLAHLRAGDITRANSAKGEFKDWIDRMAQSRIRQSSPFKLRVRPGRDL